MAKIREELILYDKFTNTFTSYIRQTSEAMTKTRQAQNTVNEFAQSQRSATRAANSLTGSIRNLAGAFVGLQGIRTLFGWSDQMTASRARLDMMNDGLQTTKELQDMIFQSAMRARGSYMETMGFVAKLGTLAGNAFSSNQEIVAFAEQINKQMVLSGTHTWEAQAAMLQLTQGLASGVLRGEELNSVLEQTPMIAQTIAKYMGVTTGEMREMASQGLVTAEVVKNAMFWAADETNAAFENMPLTWAQAWTMAQNIAIRALNPVLLAIGFLANNIQIIGPLVLGLGAAFAVFQIAANWTKIATAATTAYHFAVNLLSIGFGVLRGSTAAASAAVFTFNSALLASPITWIVLIVLLLVAALYAGVAAFCYNSVIVPIQNYFAAAANFIGNVFHDPVTAVKVLFYDMALTVLGYIQKMAQGIEDLINEIPGVKVNITSAIDNLYGTMSANREAAIAAGSYKEFIKPLEYQDYSAAYQSGYNFGRDLEGKAASWFSGGAGLSSPAGIDASGMAGDVGNIAKGVSDINKAVNMSEEDIRSLVDVAERRYVNHINLTSQTPVITINGQNTGNTAADRQNLADAIRDILIEQVASGSVRSTARA